jgi:hypothetical protein
MKCSLCEKRIWFWQDWDDDKNKGKAHKSCLIECKEVLELERKTAIKSKKELERLEKKRIEDAKKVREKILSDLDKEDQQTKKVKSNGTRDLLDTQSESEEGQTRAKTSDFVDNQSAGEIDDEIRSEVKDT